MVMAEAGSKAKPFECWLPLQDMQTWSWKGQAEKHIMSKITVVLLSSNLSRTRRHGYGRGKQQSKALQALATLAGHADMVMKEAGRNAWNEQHSNPSIKCKS